MRASLLILVAAVMIPATAIAKGPREPLECPSDVIAAVAAECPCDGVAASEGEAPSWRNHGRYVRCVVQYVNRLRKSDCLTKEDKRALKRCAARSTCGKEGRVLCCVPRLDTCDDPTPGDELAEGACAGDAEVACDTDADCSTVKASIARSEEECLEKGGTAEGNGSVCTACVTPAP